MRSIKWLLILCLFALSSCKVGCDIEDSVSAGMSASIATALQCSNKAQIQSDVKGLLDKAGICSASQSKEPRAGLVGSIVCPMVAKLAVSELSNKIPASWGCNPSLASGGLDLALTTACNLIPF